ncbi:unnamed protein product, partial [Durusdinium trenchii]
HLQGGSMAISTGASTGPTTNDVKASSQLKAFSDEFVQDVPSFQLSSSLQKFAMQAHPVETPPVHIARPLAKKSHPPVARQLFQEPEVEAQLPYQFFDRHSQSDIEFDSQVQSPSQLVPPPGPEIAA